MRLQHMDHVTVLISLIINADGIAVVSWGTLNLNGHLGKFAQVISCDVVQVNPEHNGFRAVFVRRNS